MNRKSLPFLGLMLVGTCLSGAIASCSSPNASNQAPATPNQEVKVTLVSYAVTQSAYEKIIPKFVKIEKAGLIAPDWEKEAPNEAIVTKSVD